MFFSSTVSSDRLLSGNAYALPDKSRSEPKHSGQILWQKFSPDVLPTIEFHMTMLTVKKKACFLIRCKDNNMELSARLKVQSYKKSWNSYSCLRLNSLLLVDLHNVMLTMDKTTFCPVHSKHCNMETNARPKIQLETKKKSGSFFCLRLNFSLLMHFHIVVLTANNKTSCAVYCNLYLRQVDARHKIWFESKTSNSFPFCDWILCLRLKFSIRIDFHIVLLTWTTKNLSCPL